MRRPLILFLVLVLVLFLETELSVIAPGIKKGVAENIKPAAVVEEKPEFPDRVGEKVVYDVMLGGIRLGQAVFYYPGKAELDGRPVSIFTFETSLFRFKDKEKIYSQPRTFLPLKVEREISSWPKYEKITEIYDQDKFTLNITHTESGKDQVTNIKKESVIHNSILLPYLVREIPDLAPGWSFRANLPTQSFKIELTSIEEVNVAGGKFKAYHFKSTPEKFEIWISDDERKIPLRIKGMSGIGYILEMREYLPGTAA